MAATDEPLLSAAAPARKRSGSGLPYRLAMLATLACLLAGALVAGLVFSPGPVSRWLDDVWARGKIAGPPHPASRPLPALPGAPADVEHRSGEAAALDAETARRANLAQPFVTVRPVPARSFAFTGSAADRAAATHCLALAALAEAGGGDPDQRAVMQVILNRARHPAYPGTVCEVVFQGAERTTGCQFTFTCDGALSRKYGEQAWRSARMRATQALDGYVFKPVGTATHYHTDWVRPYWAASLDKIARVDTHLFYRWQGYWGTPGAFRRKYRGGEPDPAELIGKVRESENDAASPVLETAAGGSLSIEADRAEVTVRSPSGKAFLVMLRTRSMDRSVALARGLCGGNGYCQVMGWSDRKTMPPGFPVTPEARARMEFSYVIDDQNREILRFNCASFPAALPEQCLAPPAPVTGP